MTSQIKIFLFLLNFLTLTTYAQIVTEKYPNGNNKSEGIMKFGQRDSIWNKWYSSGNIFSKGAYVRDSMNGQWNFFYENGKLLAKINYKMSDGGNVSSVSGIPINGRDGYCISYFQNGRVWQEQNWKDGINEGLQIYYSDSGKKVQELNYKNGIIKEKVSYYSSGSIEYRGFYKKNEKDSMWVYYYENGDKQEENYLKNGELEGKRITYYSTGQIQFVGYYKNGKVDSLATSYFENGAKKSVEFYKKGEIDGLEVSYFPDGSKKSEIFYKNGVRHGSTLEWSEKNNLTDSCSYVNGYLKGLCKKWYDNGIPKSEGQFDTLKTGRWIEWYKNGQKKSEGNYISGWKNGLWIEWFENGRKKSEGVMKDNGYKGNFIEWDEDGGKIETTNDTIRSFYGNGMKKYELKINGGFSRGGGSNESYMLNWWDKDGSQLIKNGNGKSIKYFSNGQVKEDAEYKDGQRDGFLHEYFPCGIIKNVTEYTSDRYFNSEIIYPGIGEQKNNSLLKNNAKAEYSKLVSSFIDLTNWNLSDSGITYHIFNDSLKSKNCGDSIWYHYIFWLSDGTFLSSDFDYSFSHIYITPDNNKDPFVVALKLFKLSQTGIIRFNRNQISKSKFFPSDYSKKDIICFIEIDYY